MSLADIFLNGKRFLGRSLSIEQHGPGDQRIVIDGNRVEISSSPKIDIVVNGNLDSLQVGSATVQVHGTAGSVKTGSGDVTCGAVSGNVSTGSGDVKCDAVQGDVTTSSGDVECGDVSGNIKTSSGDISTRRR